MKIRLIISSLCILSLGIAHSQNFRAGILAGVAGTQVDGDGLSGYDKGGLNFGGLSNFKWNDRWSSQFEITYFQKGCRSPFDSTGTRIDYRLHLHYIEIPVLMIYHFKLKGRWMAESGFSFAKLLDSKFEQDGIEYEGNFKKYDYDYLLGVGYALGSKLFLNLRFSYSVTPIAPSIYHARQFFGPGQFNNVLGFSLRYYFKSF